MFRKLLAIIVLGALLYVAFHYSRNVTHEGDLVATLIFDAAPGVGTGTPLTEKGVTIGEVTSVGSVGSKAAVTVAVPVEHRNRIFTDSTFEIAGDPPEIRVLSAISVGAPLSDGAVIVARNDKFARLVAKGSEKLAPHLAAARQKALTMIGEYDSEDFAEQLDEWSKRVPEWKAEGKDVLKKNLDAVEETVDEIESALRKIKRDAEADKIRKAFSEWMKDVGK
jgi:hypothetical protein